MKKSKHIKTPHARKPQLESSLKKQALGDLEHLISMDLGSFLILNEEGKKDQITQAKQKVRSDLLKYKDEMSKLARDIGGDFPDAVNEFIKSVNEIIVSAGEWLDQATINETFKATENLEQKLKHKKSKNYPKNLSQ